MTQLPKKAPNVSMMCSIDISPQKEQLKNHNKENVAASQRSIKTKHEKKLSIGTENLEVASQQMIGSGRTKVENRPLQEKSVNMQTPTKP